MEIEKNVFEIWKKLGETPLEALESFRQRQRIDSQVKMTYAGRLDPMAEGKMILLVDEAVHKKDLYNQKNKSYLVEILVGFSTDTNDILGKIDSDPSYYSLNDESDDIKKTSKQIATVAQGSIGFIIQQYPAFSSKPVHGKPLFVWARNHELHKINIPTHSVRLDVAEVIHDDAMIGGSELYKKITKKIELISGDFRQKEILDKWGASINAANRYAIITINIQTGPGFYVRQFVRDISKKINVPLVVYSICRDEIFL